MLSSCFSRTFTAFRNSHNFCSSFLYFRCSFYFFKIFLHIPKSIFFSKRRNRSRTKDIVTSKQFFRIFMNFPLIFSRKVQVNIWHFISIKSHEYFKWNGMPIFYVFCTTFWTIFIRIVNSASFLVHKFRMLTVWTSVMRVKSVYFGNSHKIGDN